MFVLGFPLLLIPFVIYNIVAFIFRLPNDNWTAPVTTVRMMSGQDWVLTWEDFDHRLQHPAAGHRDRKIDAGRHAHHRRSHAGDAPVHRHAG